MFETYFIPVLIFAALGVFAGILLTVVSKIFAVETDPRIDEVNEALPQVNCGACGFSGCSEYARAIVEDGVQPNLCKPGGNNSADKIAEIMGVNAGTAEKLVAIVRCSGNCETEKNDFMFDGYGTCRNAKRFYGGKWACKYGCLGYGDCIEVCPTGAVSVTDGLASISTSKCIGCGLCAKACPNEIIDIRKVGKIADVKCSSKDMGKVVRTVCKSGCIGCKICEKQCDFDAIHVTDNIARVDYEKCTGCGKCAGKCPAHVIEI